MGKGMDIDKFTEAVINAPAALTRMMPSMREIEQATGFKLNTPGLSPIDNLNKSMISNTTALLGNTNALTGTSIGVGVDLGGNSFGNLNSTTTRTNITPISLAEAVPKYTIELVNNTTALQQLTRVVQSLSDTISGGPKNNATQINTNDILRGLFAPTGRQRATE
jgi:hypothetical protein